MKRRPASIGRGVTSAPVRVLLVAVLMLCLSWQALLVRAHSHAARPRDAAFIATLSHPVSPEQSPATCPVCRELALAGAYLPTTPPALTIAATVPALVMVIAVARDDHAVLPRHDRIRDPPSRPRT